MRKPYHRTTATQIEKVKELSGTHYVKEIVKITGLSKMVVLAIQNNPANGILNPKRKCPPRRGKVVQMQNQYFSYGKEYTY